MAVMGAYCGIADVLLIWWHGNSDKIPVRLVSVLCIAAWGLAGMTSGPLPSAVTMSAEGLTI